MSLKEKGGPATVAYSTGVDHENLSAVKHADDVRLAQLGYKSEFKREFSVSLFSLIPTMHCSLGYGVIWTSSLTICRHSS